MTARLSGPSMAREKLVPGPSPSPRCSTNPTRRSTDGSRTASSMLSDNCLDTACRARQRRQGRHRLRSRRRQRQQRHLCGPARPGLPLRQRAQDAAASRRATAWSSTCRCPWKAWSPCRHARASGRPTRWCSAAFRRSACRSASSMWAPSLVITADEQMRGGKALPLKPRRRRSPRAWAAAKPSSRCIVYRRTRRQGGLERRGRDLWMHDVAAEQADTCDRRAGGCRASAVHPLHVRLDRQAQGRAAHSPAGYLLWALMTMKWTFDVAPRRRVLVYRRHRLDHRPHLYRLRPAGGRRRRR